MNMLWMMRMMKVGGILEKGRAGTSGTPKRPTTRLNHKAMVNMIQMVRMMEVAGTLRRGKAGSCGSTNTPITLTLHIYTTLRASPH